MSDGVLHIWADDMVALCSECLVLSEELVEVYCEDGCRDCEFDLGLGWVFGFSHCCDCVGVGCEVLCGYLTGLMNDQHNMDAATIPSLDDR